MTRTSVLALFAFAIAGCAQQDIADVARGAGGVLVRGVGEAIVDSALGDNVPTAAPTGDIDEWGNTARQRDYCASRGNQCLATYELESRVQQYRDEYAKQFESEAAAGRVDIRRDGSETENATDISQSIVIDDSAAIARAIDAMAIDDLVSPTGKTP